MLVNATCKKLAELGLSTMAEGLADQLSQPERYSELSFEDRLGLLVDKEADAKDTRRVKMRLRVAKLRYPASVEDLDLRTPRGLDKGLVMELAAGTWVGRHHNAVVTGPTGVGKSFIACALAQAAIRTGHSAYYV
ncbi:IstB ATP binding domain-containing protein, partial [mine drainage metagenome]